MPNQKVYSVSLSDINTYGRRVHRKYFQGQGPSLPTRTPQTYGCTSSRDLKNSSFHFTAQAMAVGVIGDTTSGTIDPPASLVLRFHLYMEMTP